MGQDKLLDCSILLLAGGRGQRMGGQDKGLMEWHGKPLIAWSHRIARPMTDDLLVSCNRNQSAYAPFADRLVADDEPDFPGPLAGIRSGLAAARHKWLIVLPCDAPLINKLLLNELYAMAQAEPGRPIMVRRGEQWEPLFCIIPVYLGATIEEAWLSGERSNRKILLALQARALNLRVDDTRLANLNSPELLALHEPRLGT